MYKCESCGAEFDTLTRLRLHKEDCNSDTIVTDDERVTAFSKIGSGPEFQSRLDRRRNRLAEHDIESIKEAVDTLRSRITDYGVEGFIQELWYHELIRSTSYHTLDEDTGIPPKMVEYLFGLATTVESTENNSKSVGFYDIIDALSLVYDQIQLERDKIIADAESREELTRAFVQNLQIERELTTGRFAHGAQRKQFAEKVYSQVDEEISDIIGISASEAISCAEAVEQWHEEVVTDDQLVPIAAHVANLGDGPFQVDLEEAIEKGFKNPETSLPRVWVNVAKYDNHRLNPLNSDHNVGDFSQYEEDFGTVRDVAPDLGFNPDRIQNQIRDSPAELDTFLEEFGVGFGEYSMDPTDRTGSAKKFDYPFDHNPIHETPFLGNSLGDHYLGPQNSIWYSLSTRFRYDILGSECEGSATEKMSKAIEKWVENCFEDIGSTDFDVLSGVDYDFEDGESDVVLVFDETIVVVEVKTRGLRLGSRLGPYGSFEQLQEDAEEVIYTPYKGQAMKLINGIKRGDVTEIKEEDRTISVTPQRFSEYIPVVVLSQPLDFVGTVLHADLIDFGDEYPYLTDVYALQTLCKHLSDGEQLLNYLNRRIQVGVSGRAFSIDEMDYVGEFLENGLQYPDVPERAIVDITHAGSYLERFYD